MAHDHVRIEQMMCDGIIPAEDEQMKPSLDRPGRGLEFKHGDAAGYRVEV